MPTPQVPNIQSSKAALNATDTATLLAAIFNISPLPATKTEANVRAIAINVVPGPSTVPPGAGTTCIVVVQFNP